MITPKIEEARIKKALRDCKERGFEVLDPEQCVEEAIEKFGRDLCVSCSFGSCSVVVLHMALKVDPNIVSVFNNTGVEYPETLQYRHLLQSKWLLNVVETKPIKSFWKCWKEYGPPLPRLANYHAGDYKRGIPSYGKPKCCIYLKELPFKKTVEAMSLKATLTGMRAAESRARMFAFSQFGQNYTSHKFGTITKFNPIAFWTRKQVWDYLKDNKIPINAVYLKGADRTGCMPCTAFKHWEAQLAKTNPRMYHYLQKLRGVTLIDDFIELENLAVESCSQREVQGVLEQWF